MTASISTSTTVPKPSAAPAPLAVVPVQISPSAIMAQKKILESEPVLTVAAQLKDDPEYPMIKKVILYLEHLVAKNKKPLNKGLRFEIDIQEPRSPSMEEAVFRYFITTNFSANIFLVALIYIDRVHPDGLHVAEAYRYFSIALYFAACHADSNCAIDGVFFKDNPQQFLIEYKKISVARDEAFRDMNLQFEALLLKAGGKKVDDKAMAQMQQKLQACEDGSKINQREIEIFEETHGVVIAQESPPLCLQEYNNTIFSVLEETKCKDIVKIWKLNIELCPLLFMSILICVERASIPLENETLLFMLSLAYNFLRDDNITLRYFFGFEHPSCRMKEHNKFSKEEKDKFATFKKQQVELFKQLKYNLYVSSEEYDAFIQKYFKRSQPIQFACLNKSIENVALNESAILVDELFYVAANLEDENRVSQFKNDIVAIVTHNQLSVRAVVAAVIYIDRYLMSKKAMLDIKLDQWVFVAALWVAAYYQEGNFPGLIDDGIRDNKDDDKDDRRQVFDQKQYDAYLEKFVKSAKVTSSHQLETYEAAFILALRTPRQVSASKIFWPTSLPQPARVNYDSNISINEATLSQYKEKLKFSKVSTVRQAFFAWKNVVTEPTPPSQSAYQCTIA